MIAESTEAASARSAAHGTVSLPVVMDITAAAPLMAAMLAHRGKDVRVDASRVERMGAQCLQVLLSAAATWSLDGMDFEVSRPSAHFAEALETAGLGAEHFMQGTAK